MDRPSVVVFDDRLLWHLAPRTRFRELGELGRTFLADGFVPGRVWLGHVPCTVGVVEMPVEVLGLE